MIFGKPRFPRVAKEDVEIIRWFIRMRKKYPPPPYDRHQHGSWYPGDYIPNWLMIQTTEHLQELCEKHALKSKGSRWKLIKRMYLHWRASKLKIGKVYYGYAKGYDYQRIPTCPCGSVLKKEMEAAEKKREQLRELARQQLRKFLEPVQRFPRE
jgi:hypothetical protein